MSALDFGDSVSERPAAAEGTIVAHEHDTDRQRGPLDIVLKPEPKLHGAGKFKGVVL